MTAKVLPLLLLFVFGVSVQAQPATGPTLSWTIPTADAASVTRWQACLDASCSDVVPSAPVVEGANNRYKYVYPTAVSPQAHTFKVRSCNALTCVDSDDLKVTPPPKPANLGIQ